MFVAGLQQGALFGRRQLVWGEVATALEEGERAVVGDEVFGEEGLGGAEAGAEQPPQALAADLRARAGEALDRPLCARGPARPSQSRALAISPKGTPIWAMPKGPGFMPTKTTRLRPLPKRSR